MLTFSCSFCYQTTGLRLGELDFRRKCDCQNHDDAAYTLDKYWLLDSCKIFPPYDVHEMWCRVLYTMKIRTHVNFCLQEMGPNIQRCWNILFCFSNLRDINQEIRWRHYQLPSRKCRSCEFLFHLYSDSFSDFTLFSYCCTSAGRTLPATHPNLLHTFSHPSHATLQPSSLF